MTDMIPKTVDCIIIGTGLTNSILAAACSRIGRSVLHIDENNYYGNDWASFTFQQLIDWIQAKYPEEKCLDAVPEELKVSSKMFCLDLCPRLLYSNGSMVNLLVSSNVSRYHEFKNNIRILSMLGDDIHVIPCKRSDVFTSPLLANLIDKRRLMKFIELCVKYDQEVDSPETKEILESAEKPINEFLTEKQLNPALKEYIINSIAMSKPTEATKEVCERIKKFMTAIERFGRSPFLYPLYGCGEFPQSFCRLSAVFGGFYYLNADIGKIECNNEGSNTVRFSNNEYEVKSDALVLDHNVAIGQNLLRDPQSDYKIARAILITNKSIVENTENQISFLRIPESSCNSDVVFLLELNSSVMVCPPNMNILYLWTKSSSQNPKEDLEPTIKRVFANDTSPIMWSFYYSQIAGLPPRPDTSEGLTKGLYITSPPSEDIDYTRSIEDAEKIFHKICPGQEFLPRAPDPDEIISQDE